MIRVSIVGATGYVGSEIIRILANHPRVSLQILTSETYQGQPIAKVYPHLRGITDHICQKLEISSLIEASDVVFTALPHGLSMQLAPSLIDAGVKLIDLGADFRIKDVAEYQKWYKVEHTCPHLVARAVYGLPELHRDEIKNASLIANPGCYPTSIILGVAPLIKNGWCDKSSLIADSKSGVSGAGRGVSLGVHYSEVNENLKAYNIAGKHRHLPEIEQELSWLAGTAITISFSPHLIPMTRGILSTIYVNLTQNDLTAEMIENAYRAFYKEDPFIRIRPVGELPQTKEVWGSNYCDIGFDLDQRTNRIIVVVAIDNLVKGAAGQAVQNMNLLFDLDERTGLTRPPIFP